MYVMLFRFSIVMTLACVAAHPTIAISAPRCQNKFHITLDITQDFSDDDGMPVEGAVAGSTDPRDMERNYNAFSKAFNSLMYDEIVIPAGRFHFNKQLKVTHKDSATFLPRKVIRGSKLPTKIFLPDLLSEVHSTASYQTDCPATILDFTQIPDSTDPAPLLWIYGTSMLLEQLLTNDIHQGDTNYILNHGRTVHAGDLLLLSDKKNNSYGPRAGYHKGEFFKVTSVQGQSILFEAAHDDYTANRCELHKINPIHIELENILLVDTRDKARDARGNMLRAGTGLRIDRCENSKIINVYVIDASYNAGISLNNSYNVELDSCKVVMALPHETRMDRSDGYSSWSPVDAYGIVIGDSQKIYVNNVDSRSWAHAIASGSGTSYVIAMIPIVNRHIKVTNSKFTATPAPLYWKNETAVAALRKVAPANFHGNTEDSSYENNVLIGSGFNIGGHNISLLNNEIWADNYMEQRPSVPPYSPFYGDYYDSAFYFDEAKSAEFKIINNRVYIRKFYQNPHIENADDGQFCFGEFVQFNYGGNFWRTKTVTPEHPDSVDCKFTYGLAGKIYREGTLEISGNQVVVYGAPMDDNQEGIFKSSMITICGVGVDKYMGHYFSDHTVPDINTALRTQMQVDVKITNNSFITHNNPQHSRMVIAINPINPYGKNYTRIRNVEITDNHFEGFFRCSVNAANIFRDGSNQEMLSEAVVVKDNAFVLSDIADEATLLNTIQNPADPTKKVFPKTKANGTVIENNIITKV